MNTQNLISRLFRKRGISDVTELAPEEKAVFDNWQAILSKEELTIPDLREFCKSQIGTIEGKWLDLNLDHSKKAELIPYHTVYKCILSALDAPKVAREALEKQLLDQLK